MSSTGKLNLFHQPSLRPYLSPEDPFHAWSRDMNTATKASTTAAWPSSPSSPSAVVPAQLAFLALYNPTLGPTDETFPDQVVYYYSRTAHESRAAAKKHGRNDAAGGDASREEENEKLRQIGLAQGMVDFAKWVSIFQDTRTHVTVGISQVLSTMLRIVGASRTGSRSTRSRRKSRGLCCTSWRRAGGFWRYVETFLSCCHLLPRENEMGFLMDVSFF